LRAYAPEGRRAVVAGGAQTYARLITFGSELHRVLESVGLVEPILVAEVKPDPPPRVPRFALAIATTPEGAIAEFAGQQMPTPALFELDALPVGPLRVTVRKSGFAPVTQRVEASDFAADGGRLRHSVQVRLRAPEPKADARTVAPTGDQASTARAAAPTVATAAPPAAAANPVTPVTPVDTLPPGTIPLAPAIPRGSGRTGLFSIRDPSVTPEAP
jgi:hypothetical protein